MTNIASPS